MQAPQRCLLGQLICRASRSTSDQGRACSEALVDSGGPLRCLQVFGKRPKYTSPYSPNSLDRGEFLKKTFGYLKEAVGRYCGKSRTGVSMSERKRNEYLDLRQRYQPEKVRLVIVAESHGLYFYDPTGAPDVCIFCCCGQRGPSSPTIGSTNGPVSCHVRSARAVHSRGPTPSRCNPCRLRRWRAFSSTYRRIRR